jgi:hypothetical protein
VCRSGRRGLRSARSTRRYQRTTSRGKVARQEGPPSRILLAHHATRCQGTCQEMRQMSTTRGHDLGSAIRAQNIILPVALRVVGRGHPRAVYDRTRPMQIPDRRS